MSNDNLTPEKRPVGMPPEMVAPYGENLHENMVATEIYKLAFKRVFGNTRVGKQIANDCALTGFAYCRIDADGTLTRIAPGRVFVDESP